MGNKIVNIKTDVRNTNIDSMKGILIILVILGHTYNKYCYGFISLFHVGLFFVLSGYCFNQLYTDSIGSLWSLFKKKIKSLWLPYVVYNFIFLLLQNFWLKIGFLTSDKSYFEYEPFLNDGFSLPIDCVGALKVFIKSLFFINSRPFVGGLWFLGGLFYVTFLYAIIQFFMRKFRLERFHIVLSVLFLVFGWLIVKMKLVEGIPLMKHLSIILISEILFCLGTYAREYIVLSKLKKSVYWAGLVFFFLILYVLSIFGTISIAGVNIKNPLFYMVSILSGGGGIVCLVKILEYSNATKVIRFFSYVGQKTIPILALHPICFKIVTLMQWKIYHGERIILAMYPVWKNTFGWCLAYLFVGLFVPLVISFFLSKNKFCSAVLKC